MRATIVIDDKMMRTAMEISGIRTKKGVVEQAIREFVANRTRKDSNSGDKASVLPAHDFDRAKAEHAVKRLLTLREGMTLGDDLSIKELISEGRR